MISSRIAFNILLGISILYFPWWLTVAIVVLMLTQHAAYELLAWGIFADALFGTGLPFFHGIQYVFTLAFLALLLISLYVKDKVIFYN